MKKICCVNDMPGVGKIALSAMSPILSIKEYRSDQDTWYHESRPPDEIPPRVSLADGVTPTAYGPHLRENPKKSKNPRPIPHFVGAKRALILLYHLSPFLSTNSAIFYRLFFSKLPIE